MKIALNSKYLMKKKVAIKVCPECHSHLFKKDYRLHELYCRLCGLVLKAPYSVDFKTPDFKTLHLTINVPEEVEIEEKK